ncbi:MAG TPA: DUF3488 and transglutaminase-like domain-containing protein [Candidatus Hydrogenedens sp.]|nr:DUF3488 and transglutaminase-like domain-containing protein [Candidatus Hydrogenedens sp.]
MLFLQEDRHNLMLKLSVLIAVMSAYLALTAVRYYGMIMLFVPIVPLVLSFFVEKIVEKYPRYPFWIQIPLWIVSILLPLLIALLGILDTVLLLTGMIQLTLVARPKGMKEYLYIILMSFFLLLGAGVQAPEFVVGISFILFVCCVFILLPIVTVVYGKDKQGRSISVPWVQLKQIFPAYRFYLVIFVLLNIVVGWFFIISGFLFMPRMEAGIFGRDLGAISRTGIATSVSLRGGQTIAISYTPVMSVFIPSTGIGPPIPQNQLYWRITSLPTYLGIQWRRWPLEDSYEPTSSSISFLGLLRAIQVQKNDVKSSILLEKRRDMPFREVIQDIYLDNIPEDGIPVLDRVREFRVRESGTQVSLNWDSTKDYTVSFSSNNARRLVYRVVSDLIQWDGTRLRTAPDNYKETMSQRDYDLLTQHDLSPEVQARIQRIVEGKETVYDKVLAIEKWLSGPEFQYTLDIPPLPGDHPMNAFFTQIRRGHCELFASAMALAVRSLGIPSRVVSGYVGGEWDAQNRSYIVREGMAHLWVEVLFLNYGWVPFDPSPLPDSSYFMRNQIIMQLTRWMLRTRMFWYQQIVGFDRGFQLPSFGLERFGFIKSLDDYINPGRKITVPSVGTVIILLIILAILYLLGLIWQVLWNVVHLYRVKTREVYLTKDQYEAKQLFKKLEILFEKNNWNVRNLTVEEIVRELPDRIPSLYDEVQDFLEDYNLIRFGKKPWDEKKKMYWWKKIREWRNKRYWKEDVGR